MNRKTLTRALFPLLVVVPFLGGGICGVDFKSAPVSAEKSKVDKTLFGTWSIESGKGKSHEPGTLTVFESDAPTTLFFLAGTRFHADKGVVDTMTFLGHPFATSKAKYLALRSASVQQARASEPARTVPSGDYVIVRYRVQEDTLLLDLLDDDKSIAAVKSRAIGGTHVKSGKGGFVNDTLQIADTDAAVLKWLDEGATWTPYEHTFRRLSLAPRKK